MAWQMGRVTGGSVVAVKWHFQNEEEADFAKEHEAGVQTKLWKEGNSHYRGTKAIHATLTATA